VRTEAIATRAPVLSDRGTYDSFALRVSAALTTRLDDRAIMHSLRYILEQCGPLVLLALGRPSSQRTAYAEFATLSGVERALEELQRVHSRGVTLSVHRLAPYLRDHAWPPKTVVQCEHYGARRDKDNDNEADESEGGDSDTEDGEDNFDQRLVIHKLPAITNANELLAVMSQAGRITLLALGPIKKSVRTGFVLYATSSGPATAVETLSGTRFMGLPLVLQRPNVYSRKRFPPPVAGKYTFADISRDRDAPLSAQCRVEVARLRPDTTSAQLTAVLERAGPIAELILEEPRLSQSQQHTFRRAFVTFCTPEAAQAAEDLPASHFAPLGLSGAAGRNQNVMVLGPSLTLCRTAWPSAASHAVAPARTLPPAKADSGDHRRALLGVPGDLSARDLWRTLTCRGMPTIIDAAMSKPGKRGNRIVFLSFESPHAAIVADPILRSLRFSGSSVSVEPPLKPWRGPWPPALALPIMHSRTSKEEQPVSREPRRLGTITVIRRSGTTSDPASDGSSKSSRDNSALQPPRCVDDDGGDRVPSPPTLPGKRKRTADESVDAATVLTGNGTNAADIF
jgi:hypothetical protein